MWRVTRAIAADRFIAAAPVLEHADGP